MMEMAGKQILNMYNFIDQLSLYIEIEELKVLGLTEDEIIGNIEVMLDNALLLKSLEPQHQSHLQTNAFN